MFAFLRHFLYVIHGCLKDALVNPNDSSADLEVQLVQLNHCDGEYSNY